MGKIRCGVIGLGMGRGHIAGYSSHPDAEVVAIADVDKKRLSAVGSELGIDARYDTAQEMLRKEKLDVVSVATPNKFHKPVTIAALRAGCHVLCEKPMAMSAAEARSMLAAAAKAGKRLMINFSFRFNEVAQALKARVDAGVLGDVYFARTVWQRRRGLPGLGGWFGRKALSGGGPLIDLGVHRIDLALWLMGYPRPVWVMGSTYDHIASAIAKKQRAKFDVEDFAVGLVKFDNGATLEAEASWAGHIKERELMETRLLGTRGGLVYKNVGEGYEFDAEIFTEHDGHQFDTRLHPGGKAPTGAMAHFIDCIIEDKPHIATGEEGLIVMQFLDALYRSAATGKPVRVRP